jgi:copper homeostasis protein CutC
MAGGGVREENVREIVDATGVREVHARLTRLTRVAGSSTGAGVKVRKALPSDEAAWEETDEARIRRLVATLRRPTPRADQVKSR